MRTALLASPLACVSLLVGAEANAQPEADTALEVSLLTFGPGEIYWERFGHNAIVIRDPASGRAVSYNYGMFDFDDADFFGNFLLGRMSYQMAANNAADDVALYAEEGRSVIEQRLRLSPAQARALKDKLDWNLRPENTRYRYDYFTSNCSTKVRDALDEALGGTLRQQMISPSRGFTYRLLADALTSPAPPLMGVIDAGLGPFADQRLSFWNDSFVPMQLMSHLRELKVKDTDGSLIPLVVEERVLVPARLPDPPELPPDLRWPFFAVGIVFSALLLTLFTRRERNWARASFATLACLFSLLCGITGLVLLGLWGFTEHRSAWGNENLFLLNPLCLLLLPAWWRSARVNWSLSPAERVIVASIALLAAFALFSKILSTFVQANLHWILLLLPIHIVLARAALGARFVHGRVHS